MKFFIISDNVDAQMGMRIAGIEGAAAYDKEQALGALEKAVEDEEIAVVLMTEKLVKLCYERVYDIKLNCRRPLIVEVPDRGSKSGAIDAISRYVEEALGIKL